MSRLSSSAISMISTRVISPHDPFVPVYRPERSFPAVRYSPCLPSSSFPLGFPLVRHRCPVCRSHIYCLHISSSAASVGTKMPGGMVTPVGPMQQQLLWKLTRAPDRCPWESPRTPSRRVTRLLQSPFARSCNGLEGERC